MRKSTLSCATAAAVLVLSGAPAHAEPGALDPTFGGDGKVTTRVTPEGGFDVAYGVAMQGDKIVAVGRAARAFAAVRYLPNGSVDKTFGDGGKVITPIGVSDTAYAVAVQPDGKIVAVGVTNNDAFAVARYTPDGALDESFGDKGKVVTGFTGGPDVAYAVTLQPDGKIVAVGQAGDGGVSDVALARYTADGALDESFGDKGKVVTAGPGSDTTYAVAMQGDKIVLAGGYGGALAAARYDATGKPDPAFGKEGIAVTGSGTAYAVVLQGDKVLVAGSSRAAFAVARFDPAGTLDTTFGREGVMINPLSSGHDAAWGMVLQGEKIVVGGVVSNSFGVARYEKDGALDATFDDDGTLTTNFTDEKDSAYAITVQPDGKVVLAGSAGEAGGLGDFALARYEP